MIKELLLQLAAALTVGGIVALITWISWDVNRAKRLFFPTLWVSECDLLYPLFGVLPYLLLREPSVTGLILNLFFQLMLSVFAATLLLLVMVPLLRRRISAVGCATLWLLPIHLVVVGFTLILLKWVFQLKPWLVIRLPRTAVRILLALWAAGFLTVLGWKILSHLRFRRTLLRDAVPVSEAEETLFREVRGQIYKRKDTKFRRLRVLRSPAAASPLSVGLFVRKTFLVLPQKEYSEEELRLIYRHEIIHLLHMDNNLKFNMTVLCALGWFIPSLWSSLSKAAEDVELCCDELAIDDLGPNCRRQYADLLLNSAGTAAGFTTCLSDSASGLRYRLQQILHPRIRRTGTAATALLTALFVFFLGVIGVDIKVGTVRTEFLDRYGGGWRVSAVRAHVPVVRDDDGSCWDPEAVEACISDLKLIKQTSSIDSMWIDVSVELQRDNGEQMELFFHEENGASYMMCNWPDHDVPEEYYQYQIDGDLDLNWLKSMAGADEGMETSGK